MSGPDDDDIISAILRREGATYTNLPTDRGGPTKYGITLATLSAWRKVPVTADDVRLLTEVEARMIYAARYITGPGFDSIADDRLRALVVDCGVLHGQPTAARWLQAATGAHVDGVLDPASLAAIAKASPVTLYCRVLAARIRAEGADISRNPAQAQFAGGWAGRCADLLEALP